MVSDPVGRSLLADDGIDPDTIWFPPMAAEPGEYTIDDMVRWIQSNSRESLAAWLPGEKGTDLGAFDVDLVNSFVEDLFPVLSDEGAEWSHSLSADQKVLHDLLNEDVAWPEDATYEEQIAFVESLLEVYRERGGG